MTFVLNRNWGGFHLPRDFANAYGERVYADIDRQDPRLIKWVRDHADKNGNCGDLACVEIPDTCSDYEINEYDGLESITYVVDGRIYHA